MATPNVSAFKTLGNSFALFFLLFSFSLSAQERIWRYSNNSANTPGPLGATEVSLDSMGHVYLLKNAKRIYKFNQTTGSLMLNYDLTGDSTIHANGMFVDSLGFVVVAGSQRNRSGNSDAIVAKFDSTGQKVWQQVINGSSNATDSANAFEVDQHGNIYVLTTLNNTSSVNANADVVTYKYDSNGMLIWSTTFNGALNGKDLGRDLAINSMGEVFITGSTQDYSTYEIGCNCSYRSNKAFLIKYDSSGSQSWIKKSTTYNLGIYNDPTIGVSYPVNYNDDIGYQVEVEGNSLYYVRDVFNGASTDLLYWTSNLVNSYNTQLIRYNFNGSVVNSYNYSRPSSSSNNRHKDIVEELRVNSLGEVYLKVELPRQNSSGLELVKLNSSFGELFRKNYSHTFNFDQISFTFQGSDTYLAHSRTIYTSNTPGIVVYKFDNSGNQISSKGFLGSTHIAQDLVLDAAGDLYMASGGFSTDFSKLCGSVPTVQTIADTSVCFGDSIQLLTTSDAATFSWSNGVSLSSDSILSPFASPTLSTSYTVTASYLSGCSSTTTVRVEVPSETLQLTLCNNDSVIVRGKIYRLTGTYFDTISNLSGCDSIITINVVSGQDSSYAMSATICQGDSLLFGGEYIKMAGLYSDTLSSASNCDSIINLTVTTTPSYLVMDSLSICQGDSVLIFGIYRKIAGIYQDVYQTSSGCDSIYSTALLVNPVNQTTQVVSACGTYTWSQNGQTYLASVQVDDTLMSASGCDSILTLDLTIHQSTQDTVHVATCGDYVWMRSGSIYRNSGFYADTLATVNGCDSVTVLDLSINSGSVTVQSITACESYTWSHNSLTYTTSGIYRDTVPDGNGCDSIVELDLTINTTSSSLTTVSFCNAYLWTNGITYTNSGVYFDTLVNSANCDSIAQLNLTIGQSYRDTTVLSTCGSYSWSRTGNTYFMSGTYNDVQTSVNGCDSTGVLILNINALPAADAGVDQAICEGQSVVIGGSPTGPTGATYLWNNASSLSSVIVSNPSASPTVTTTYSVTVTDGSGCTTVDDVVVTVNPLPIAGAGMDQSICEGQIVFIGGAPTGPAGATFAWDNAGSLTNASNANPMASPLVTTIYSVTVTDVNGCTSTDNIVIAVQPNPGADAGLNTAICNGQSVVIGGSPTSTTLGATYLWDNAASLNDNTFANPTASPTVSTDYTVTVTHPNGCTATDIISVAVSSSYPTSSTSVSACGSYTWAQNGQTYTNSGTYRDTVPSPFACDTIKLLNLTINNINTTIGQSGFTLTAVETGASYQWFNCSSALITPIVGATNQSFTANSNGDYSVEVTKSGCTDTSSCITVLGVGIDEVAQRSSFKVYPNPSNAFIIIEVENFFDQERLTIHDLSGKLIYQTSLSSSSQKIDVSTLSSGVYFVSVGNNRQKVVVY